MKLSSRTAAVFSVLLLVAVSVVAYARTAGAGFIWDDDSHVYTNPVIIGPLGLREIWTTAAANYFPLVLTNFWFQHALWALNPAGYHIVTVAFHAAAMILLWLVLQRLEIPGALLAAAWWGIHPVQVESVAWVSELKNTQSAVFFLLSIFFFDRWVARPIDDSLGHRSIKRRYGDYVGALLFATGAILSKPSTVMLPVALWLMWWWRCRTLRWWRAVIWLSPFFALSGLATVWTVWEQKFHSGAIGGKWDQSFAERLGVAGHAIWFYVGKLFWPSPLIFIYPRWTIDTASWATYFPPLSAMVLLGCMFFRRRKAPGAWIATAYFVALLFPVLGFFNVYFFRYSFVGDHFQYLASMGPIAFCAASLTVTFRRYAFYVGSALVAVLGGLTIEHSTDFQSQAALWLTTTRLNPEASMAWVHLGDVFIRQQRHDEAMKCFQRALAVDPNDADAHNDIGCEYLYRGDASRAIPELRRAVELAPGNADARNNLGFALREIGRPNDAISEYEHALRIKPKFADAHNNLAIALMDIGRVVDAVPHLELSLKLKPKDADLHHNLGNALLAVGRTDEAIQQYQRALTLGSDNAELHDDYGRALLERGDNRDAIKNFEHAIKLRPRLGSAHEHLGLAYVHDGRLADALVEFHAAVANDPKSYEAQLSFGRSLTSFNRWKEAREAFAQAVVLRPDSAEAHRDLAMAEANLGGVDDAMAQFQTALSLDPNAAETHEAFAQLLRFVGRSKEAEAQIQRANELRRASPASESRPPARN